MEVRLLKHMIMEIEKVKLAGGKFVTNNVENEPMKDDPDVDKMSNKLMRTAVGVGLTRVVELTSALPG